jgi:hypothetical protein
MAIKYTKWPQQNPNGQRIYQPLPFEGPPKFTEIGLKGFHLATLAESDS